MNQKIVETVVEAARRGQRICIGRAHVGPTRIKIRKGLLGLFTQRFEVDSPTLEAIESRLQRST